MGCRAHQAPLCMGFSRQEYRSMLDSFSRDLPNQGSNLGSLQQQAAPAFQADSLLPEPPGKPDKRLLLSFSVFLLYSVVSNSLWPHGLQAARLLCPRDFPGKKISVVLVAYLCPTLCEPMDCSPSGSSVHGILQAGILEWVATPFSRGSSWPGIKPRSPAL